MVSGEVLEGSYYWSIGAIHPRDMNNLDQPKRFG